MSRSKLAQGIIVGGNWILDEVKVVDVFPTEQTLANILDEFTSNGGSAYNILVNLSQLGASFPLEAVGLVGKDSAGERIIEHCLRQGINVNQLHRTPDASTSYTVVTSVRKTGKRTFFHHRGANSLLDIGYFDFTATHARIFHLGYLMLLDQLDCIQEDGRTGASRVLEMAKNKGLITSVDLVSEQTERFRHVVPSSLPFVDILFLNEFEASKLSGLDLMDILNPEDQEVLCIEVFKILFAMGVREWVIIHWATGVWAGCSKGTRLYQQSLNLPRDRVVGANGAGDALAAAVLFGIHEEWHMKECLELGVCTAAACLSHVTCSDGIKSYQECLSLGRSLGCIC